MDRRELLLGMTAMGLAGPLNLGQLLSAQSSEANSPVSRCNHERLTSLDFAGLRGPVKMCIEDRDSGGSVTITEYGVDGKFLSSRTEFNGKVTDSSSDSDWLESEEHDSQGRVVKHLVGRRGEPAQETVYTYDSEGRLLTSTQTGRYRLEYRYQADGSKISVQTFDPSTIERVNGGGTGDGSDWDWAQWGSGVPIGGTVTTIHDSADYERTICSPISSICLRIRCCWRPTEMQIRSADGQIVTRMVRTYDGQGRLTEEKTLEKNLGLMFDLMPQKKRDSITPEQIQRAHEYFVERGKAERGTGTTFAYDDEGRVTETRERNRLFDQTKSILYNERGDRIKVREQTTFKVNWLCSELPPEQDIRYDYQYDSYGNWTEQAETVASNGSSVHTRRTRRVLTYY